MATSMRGLTQVRNKLCGDHNGKPTGTSVHRGYPWCKGKRTGREEDKQGDGEYPKEIQRFERLRLV